MCFISSMYTFFIGIRKDKPIKIIYAIIKGITKPYTSTKNVEIVAHVLVFHINCFVPKTRNEQKKNVYSNTKF
ncbi:hypothetical protein BpHYR1_009972 [Brachionus plicatilis]|uniref:Uncharacterized protein n=1 Tax=Brachionus plicatilis TaxID=10195 RepID=A0A3M7PVW0_BRAPC|nr:hypothetical protein BpHYR1_009972 [Brachionus plicatilis]